MAKKRSKFTFLDYARAVLDWETMNKLAKMNPDFASFVDDVVKTARVQEVNRSKFDSIVDDPQEYIREELGIRFTRS